MALFKIDFAAEGRMQSAFLLDSSDEMVAEMARDAFGEAVPGVHIGSARRVADDLWFSTDREGIIVTQEEGDVEYDEPILSNELLTLWGSDSAATLIEDAGVSAGYEQVAAEIAAARLDKDDLARIADALQLAWDNANAGRQKNRDRAVRSVLQGMAGAYAETLAKVEALLEKEDRPIVF